MNQKGEVVMSRMVSRIIADMIHNRIEMSELSDIKKKYTDKAGGAGGASALLVVNIESAKIIRRMNEDFDELLNELERCIMKPSHESERR